MEVFCELISSVVGKISAHDLDYRITGERLFCFFLIQLILSSEDKMHLHELEMETFFMLSLILSNHVTRWQTE